MTNGTTARAASIAATIGATLSLASSLLTNQRQPWDGPLYWELVYLLAIAACVLRGYRFPARPWRWPLVLFEAQCIAMCVRNGDLVNL